MISDSTHLKDDNERHLRKKVSTLASDGRRILARSCSMMRTRRRRTSRDEIADWIPVVVIDESVGRLPSCSSAAPWHGQTGKCTLWDPGELLLALENMCLGPSFQLPFLPHVLCNISIFHCLSSKTALRYPISTLGPSAVVQHRITTFPNLIYIQQHHITITAHRKQITHRATPHDRPNSHKAPP